MHVYSHLIFSTSYGLVLWYNLMELNVNSSKLCNWLRSVSITNYQSDSHLLMWHLEGGSRAGWAVKPYWSVIYLPTEPAKAMFENFQWAVIRQADHIAIISLPARYLENFVIGLVNSEVNFRYIFLYRGFIEVISIYCMWYSQSIPHIWIIHLYEIIYL